MDLGVLLFLSGNDGGGVLISVVIRERERRRERARGRDKEREKREATKEKRILLVGGGGC